MVVEPFGYLIVVIMLMLMDKQCLVVVVAGLFSAPEMNYAGASYWILKGSKMTDQACQ